jgi:2-amino-4-hydroxy-6-hydroxymethyldihydropteridine diphosphokinase
MTKRRNSEVLMLGVRRSEVNASAGLDLGSRGTGKECAAAEPLRGRLFWRPASTWLRSLNSGVSFESRYPGAPCPCASEITTRTWLLSRPRKICGVVAFSLDSRAFDRQTSSVRETAYLSLGSNLGDRAANLRAAIVQLDVAGRLLAVSAMYETQPVDVCDQPWFLNCVAAIETDKTPKELLQLALRVEAGMGRLRMRAKGARKIDIDLVLFGGLVVDEAGLKIPHPAMHQRRFVLEPLVEIAPEVSHPELGKTARELLAEMAGGQIVRRL